jgi:serine/threonine-protein kinase
MDQALIGQVINSSYEVLSELARGGMATVYRAHQLSMQRDVAIKVLPREFLHQPTFRERFKQEAAIAARLEHRAIVPVYDYGEWEGIPYIVMRLMEGRSVDNLLLNGPMSLEQTQQIIRQVASALDYAHGQGVLHRDLKPSNILLDRNGDAYITDFGIARIMSSNQQLTSSGVVGTPAYMSPEQAQGHDLDGRSDIYALGVVIFEMLTTRRPFEAETPYSVAVMQVTTPAPSPRQYNPQLEMGVEGVVLKALSKDPSQRYPTAYALAGALDDADLMPVMQTIKHPTSPNAALQQTVPAYSLQATAPSLPHPSSVTQPPVPVLPNTASYGMPIARVRRRAMPLWMYFAWAVLFALLLSAVLLASYWMLSRGETPTPATQPDFAATGVFRLTATAVGPPSSYHINEDVALRWDD